jgi:NTP pyrophosphatase (non-canonical NTP hydrolase)
MNDITIGEIQEWERSFVKRKGIGIDEQKALKIALCKLMEEVGEVAKAVIEDKWDEVPAEVTDVIVFACKMANIAEDYHQTDRLTDVIRRKITYSESRTYDSATRKLNKPKNDEFK